MFLGITFKQSILSQICTIFSKRMTDTSKYTKIRYSLVYVYGVIIVKISDKHFKIAEMINYEYVTFTVHNVQSVHYIHKQ